VAALDRCVIDVDTGGRDTGRRLDSADGNIGVLIIVIGGGTHALSDEGDARRHPGDIVDVVQSFRLDCLLAERRDAHRHIHQLFDAPLGGHDHFLQLGARAGGARLARLRPAHPLADGTDHGQQCSQSKFIHS